MYEQRGLGFGVPAQAEEDVLWLQPDAPPDLTNVSELALDTETDGKNPFVNKPIGISLAYPTWQGLQKTYLPFGHASGNMDPDLIRRWALSELRGKRIKFANAKFDIHILKNWGVDLEAIGVQPADVQFNAALLDDSRHVKVDLDTLGRQYVGYGKVQLNLNMDRLAEYPSWMLGPYAERDTELTYLVDQATQPLIQRDNLSHVLALENAIIYAVCEIEKNGCRLDVPKLHLWRDELRRLYQEAIMELYTMTGMMVEPDSPVSMEKLFHLLQIEPPVWQQKKGRKRSIAADIEEHYGKQGKSPSGGKRKYTEEELLSLNHPVFNKVVYARYISSWLSKFFDKYAAGLSGDILRSQFHQLKTTADEDEHGEAKGGGTVSGRFSSSGGGDKDSGYDFNAQQVIRTSLQQKVFNGRYIVRELFIPGEGSEFWSGDMSQIEYRIATHFANAKRIIEAYQKGNADFHAITQALIQQYRPEHDDRTITKNVNFCYVFGGTEKTLAATAGIPIKEGSELLGIMRKDAPEFPALLKNLSLEAEQRGYVSTLYGRRARFGTHEKRFYAALNRVVQGSAADIFKVYLHAVYTNRHTLGITALRQVVHDEMNGDKLPGEVYTNRLREFLNDQKVQLRVPIVWDLKTGANWKECH